MLEAEAFLQPLARYSATISPLHIFSYGLYSSRTSVPLIDHNQLYIYQCYQELPVQKPIVDRIANEYQKFPITYRSSFLLTLAERHASYALPVHTNLHNAAKASLLFSQCKALFQNLLERYSSHTPVYCDESLQETLCGVWVWSPAFTLVARLPEGSSMLTAELYTIYSAVSFLSSKTGFYIIFSELDHFRPSTGSLTT